MRLIKIHGTLIIFLFYIFMFCSDSTSSSDEDTSDISIGVLLPVTGGGPIQGDAILSAVTIAKNDINSELSESGSEYRIALHTFDTQNDIDLYVSGLQELYSDGIRFIITSSTSANLEVIKFFTDTMDVILIDQGSTSPELAAADNIYRMVPNDYVLAEAMSEKLSSDGIEHLFILYRDDIWGINLANSLNDEFVNSGGNVMDKISYAPQKPLTYMASALEQLNSGVSSAIASYGADKIGVEFISFDEGVDFLASAVDYPELRQVKWYGSDGMTMNTALLSETAAADFAREVSFESPLFGENDSQEYARVKSTVENDIQRTAYSLAVVAYDAFKIAAKTLINNPDADFSTLRNAFMTEITNYTGITGNVSFDGNGDRINSGYDFWGIDWINGGFFWVKLN